jgi:cytochrome c-type biogenesis protein CcmH
MTLFWILVAGLSTLAIVFAASGLFRRDRKQTNVQGDAINLALFKQYCRELEADLAEDQLSQESGERARHDLERELLHNIDQQGLSQAPPSVQDRHNRWLPLVFIALVPMLALTIYNHLGQADLIPQFATQQTATDTAAPLETLIVRLEDRLRTNPDDVDGWLLLGRTLFAMGNLQQAVTVFEQAYAIAPDNPEIRLGYAEMLAVQADNRLDGLPAKLITETLADYPDHLGAHWLAGQLAFQRRQFEQAIQHWSWVRERLSPESPDFQNLEAMIQHAQEQRDQQPANTVISPTATAE